MTWVRGPLWDAIWILSGVPIGLSLLLLPRLALFWVFALAVCLETAHVLSPIVLAWTCPRVRAIVRRRPAQYIVLPMLIFSSALAIGAVTSLGLSSYVPGPHHKYWVTDWRNPYPLLARAYWSWNIYHFGMQNFGILRLYRRRCADDARRRAIDKAIMLGGTAAIMAVLPAVAHSPLLALAMFGAISLNHWLSEIGLCSAASGHPIVFLTVVMLLGTAGFLWMVPTSFGLLVKAVPVILAARMGIGFVHFLYDRGLWRRRDPEMREALSVGVFKGA